MDDNELPARIRDVTHQAACGSVQRWIGLDEIGRRLDLADTDACQEAVRQAVAAGWLEADPGSTVTCVRITFEGIAASNRVDEG
jgi:hypothetical protein